jgi:serine/threonine protein kinase
MPACPHCSAAVEDGRAYCPSCGNAVDDAPVSQRDPLRGKTLAGGYVIEGLVGAGAMANVYRAQQTNLRRTVAVKVMHSHLMHDETTGRRFINEARAASRLNHPHSLAVIDFGRMDSGQPYMVMEYLRGRDLERMVREDGALSFARIIDILLQLLDALSEAHELDIIHRDLKPENIVIEPVRSGGDFVKVVDFGLAKIMNAADDVSITATGTVCGTPDFMSPEQCRGDKLDARSDLYAVGVNLFVLLTGRVPFLADTPTQALLLHLTAPAPEPREVAPDRLIPESLARVTLKALEKDPAKRYQSADAFAAALEACKLDLGSEPVASIPARTTTVRCGACGGFAPAGTKFCVECGAPVSGALLTSPVESERQQSLAPQISSQLTLVGRDKPLVSLLDSLQTPSSTVTGILIRGEAGVGKTRLIREFAGRAERRGHVVVHVEPDPWMVGVAYRALREAITQLADLPTDGGDPSSWTDASETAAQGLMEVFERGGTPKGAGRNRRRAVRDALAWAVTRASGDDAAVVVVFDDLQLIDGVSRRAARDLLETGLSERAFVIGTHTPSFDPGWPNAASIFDLQRLSPAEALLVLEQSGLQGRLLELPRQPVTPLFLEQAVRFADDATGRPPLRLGDLIHQRLTGLEVVERQVLQGIAILGGDATLDIVGRLIEHPTGVENATSTLIEAGLIKNKNGTYWFSHHVLREVALSTIPAGVHRELCRRALKVVSGKDVPAEARAWYMLGAEEAFEALLLLDQIGALALSRDDTDAAVDAYRRGMDFARVELVRGNLDDPMHAIVMFGRKLGEALTAAGRPSDGEGVLREALDFAEQGSVDQAQVMLSVARAAYSRDRVSDAIRWARKAAQVASRCDNDELLESIAGLIRHWGG